jgi:hypothetical protein
VVSLSSLWLPILLSGVFVFVASTLIHMLLGYHRNDLRAVPREDDVMAALRGFNIPPGDYAVPCPTSPAHMRSPEFEAKQKKGPIVFMTLLPGGLFGMGGPMVLWFAYSLVISFFAAYVTSRAVAPGADYLQVFRFAGTTAFMGYAMALPQFSIWYRRNWGTTLRSMFDGLIYASLTAGTFGWLWPR